MSRLRFGPKFGVLIAALVAGLFVVAFVGFTGMRSESQQADTMYSNHAVDLQDLGQTLYDMGGARGSGLLQIIGAESGNAPAALAKFNTLSATVTKDLQVFAQRAEDKRTANQTLAYWNKFVSDWKALQLPTERTAAAAAARQAAGEKLLTESNKARDAWSS
jgi:hypothetical protein